MALTVSDKYGPKTKVIRIDPHAYRILTQGKRNGETLSDVIRRLHDGCGKVSDEKE